MQQDKPASTRGFPECWGHRGASARFPENTLKSFEAAMRDGAEGIESDVHVSLDNVVIMFHDPALERTTDSSGHIKERDWHGEKGMQHVRTKKEPKQAIPTFEETIDLLMRPENQHVKFNVDVKPENDPDRLFSLMHKIISSQQNWETDLAPRILLGLWHPRFIDSAKAKLPYCRRSFIGANVSIARKYFWKDCDAFSMNFGALTSSEGFKFRQDCKTSGKKLLVWTVNEPEHMVEAVRWGIDAIITDTPQTWLNIRGDLQVDHDKIAAKYRRTFLWTTLSFYAPVMFLYDYVLNKQVVEAAGPFDIPPAPIAPAIHGTA